MQAMFIMSLFTLLFAVIANIIASGSSNTAQITAQRREETQTFFQNVATMVKHDVTLAHYTAQIPLAGGGEVADSATYIRTMPEIAKLASGRFSDPAVDAWGHPIQGAVATQYELLTSAADNENQVYVPVTAVALISAGPDGILQTPVNIDFSGILNTFVPSDANGKPTNDDIVYTFTNRDDQANQFKDIRTHMERIGVAALQEWQGRVEDYYKQQVQKYKADVAAGKTPTPPNTDIGTDPNAPQMKTLNDTANRQALGVDKDFSLLERTVTQTNGDTCDSMKVSTNTPATINDPLMLTLTNTLNRACTPWRGKNGAANTFKYVLRVYPNKTIN